MKTAKKPGTRVRAVCPDCGSTIILSRPRVDDPVLCAECESDLVVVRVNPIRLDWASDDDYDDDGYDEFEDD